MFISRCRQTDSRTTVLSSVYKVDNGDNTSPLLVLPALIAIVPRAQKKKTKRAAGSPAASTQLALCLRLAFDV